MKRRGFAPALLMVTATLLALACSDRSIVVVEVGEVVVIPRTVSLARGDDVEFTAIVTDVDGRQLPNHRVVWYSSDPELLAIDENGLAHAHFQGQVQVTAEFQGARGTARVDISPWPAITVSDSAITIYGGEQADSPDPVVLEVTNGGGGVLDGLSVQWSHWPGEPTGWLSASLARSLAPTMLTLETVTDGLATGVYHATVDISSLDDPESPVSVEVVLSLTSVIVSETDGSTQVAENGGQDAFSVELAGAPASDVVFDLVSEDPTEVEVFPTRIRFTPADWNLAQVVTVTGVDELVADGDRFTSVAIVAVDSLSDPGYVAVPNRPVQVLVMDDDVPGIAVAESDGSTTVSESGTTDVVTVLLTAQPLSTVVLDVVSTDTSEVKVSRDELTFTPATWSLGQEVTLTGADDDFLDGPQPVRVEIRVDAGASADAFDALPPEAFVVVVEDDDEAQLLVQQSEGSTLVNETGTTDDFTVSLSAAPTSDVVVSVTSADIGEVTADSATVTFSPDDWNVPRTVVLTGQDDELTDGPASTDVTLAVIDEASDDAFDDVPDAVVPVTTADDDTPGFTVTESGTFTSVAESMTQDDVSVVLDAQPRDGTVVVIDVTSTDPGEVTVSTPWLTFGPTNWLTPQTVTLTGVDERIDDGDQLTDIVFAVDAGLSDDDYDGVAPDTVTATTLDDDVADVILRETGGGTLVTESGTTDDFLVSLGSEPVADVLVDLASADDAEVTVTPSTMTFTAADWDVPQLATLTGVDDISDDGNQFTLVTASVATATTDPVYAALPGRTLSVTTTDNDQPPGITLTAIGGTTVSEGGPDRDDFTVVLDAEPASNVVVTVIAQDPGEIGVSPTSLTFTPVNWFEPQIVTVAGVDDPFLDGNVVSTIDVIVDDAASADSFDGRSASLSVTTLDDDVAELVIVEVGGTSVNESGGSTDEFTVALGAQPQSDVRILVSTSDPQEVTVGPATLTFQPGTWNAPQTVTVTGQDDAEDDGDQTSTITLTVDAAASDDAFDGLTGLVTVTTFDDDGVGFTVTEQQSTSVTEAGSSDTFTIVLDAQPASNVVMNLASGDTGEATVEPTQVTFAPGAWSVPQPIVVTGVDDAIDDGNVVTAISIAVDGASDPSFLGLQAQVLATTVDDDQAAVLLAGQSGISVPENGSATQQFTVALGSEPVSPVVIDVTTSDNGEAVVSPDSLLFTPSSWSTPQPVTVTGVNDAFDDDNQFSTITVSVRDALSDDAYDPLPSQNFGVTTVDDDDAGLVVVQSGGTTQVGEGGPTDSFTVALSARPTLSVVVLLTSSDPGEAGLSTGSLTFTTTNWSTPQTVTVSAAADGTADGTTTSTISVVVDDAASDARFDGLSTAFQVTTTDADDAGFSLGGTAGLSVTEAGSTDTFTAVLETQPQSPVVLRATSADPGEVVVAGVDSLVFTSANWSTAQSFSVQGVDDSADDGDQTTTITVSVVAASSDNAFDALPSQTASVTTVDDDAAAFVLADTTDLTVTEAGGADAFTVVLAAQPSSNVVFDVSSDDTGEVTVSAPTLTFTPGSWDQPQVVTLTGQDDPLIDGSQESLITVAVNDAASDDNYDGQAMQVSVETTDDDVADLDVVELGGTTVSESGTTDDFTVALTAQPATDVVVDIVSDDLTEATVSLASLTFTSENWSTPRTVTVTGVDDEIDDNDQTTQVTITVDDASSDDAFDGLSVAITVTTSDDDGVGFTLTEFGGTQVSESGTQDQFGVALTSEPGTNVVLNVVSTDTGEATVSTGTLSFTPGDWDQPKQVTVTGIDDQLVDGPQNTPIVVSVNAASSDDAFDALPPDTVIATTLDNDTPGFNVTETGAGTTATEGGPNDTFSVVLTRGPVTPVTFDIASQIPAQLTVSPQTLTFTSENWSMAQSVTVTAVDDQVVDGPVDVTITVAVNDGASDDAFDPLANQTITASAADNDAASFSISGTPSATEGAAMGSFDVVLGRGPLADVVLSVVSADPEEASVAPGALTFTPTNWSTPQTVTVTAVDDLFVDGTGSTTITVSVDDPQSAAAWDPLPDQTVSASTSDNDVAGYTFAATNGSTAVDEDGSTDSVSVVLTAGPVSDVVIAVQSGDTGEATVAPASLTFTPADWGSPQFVVVTGVDDGGLLDGEQTTTLTASVVDLQSDGAWQPLANQTQEVSTADTDVAGFSASPTGAGTTVDESGTQDSIAVVLTAQPLPGQVVVFDATRDVTDEASVAPATLTFGNADWSTPQYFVVTGIDDATPLVDGPGTTLVTVAVDDGSTTSTPFDGLPDQIVSVTTTDDDAAGFSLTESSLVAAEGGPGVTFDAVLTAEPLTPVRLTVAVSTLPGEATAGPTALDFDGTNWSVPQTVTVTAVDDDVDDGDQAAVVTVSVDDASSAAAWGSVADQTVDVTTQDDDTRGFSLSTTSLGVLVDGDGTFEVVLTAEPLGNVVLTVTSAAPMTASAAPATLTFTPDVWDQPQTVTVTGNVVGTIDVTIAVDTGLTLDDAWDGLPPQVVTVSVTNQD